MKRRLAGIGSMMVVAILLAGCAAIQGDSNPFSGARSEREVKVFITNLAFMDATVYGVTTGGRHRLGMVTGKKEATFTMPLRFPSLMHLEIDLLAGPRCETEKLVVDPGDHLELIINHEHSGLRCRGG